MILSGIKDRRRRRRHSASKMRVTALMAPSLTRSSTRTECCPSDQGRFLGLLYKSKWLLRRRRRYRRLGLGLLLRRRRRGAGLSRRLGVARLRRRLQVDRFGIRRFGVGRLGDDGLLIGRLLGFRLIVGGACRRRFVLGFLFRGVGIGGNVGGKRGELRRRARRPGIDHDRHHRTEIGQQNRIGRRPQRRQQQRTCLI